MHSILNKYKDSYVIKKTLFITPIISDYMQKKYNLTLMQQTFYIYTAYVQMFVENIGRTWLWIQLHSQTSLNLSPLGKQKFLLSNCICTIKRTAEGRTIQKLSPSFKKNILVPEMTKMYVEVFKSLYCHIIFTPCITWDPYCYV